MDCDLSAKCVLVLACKSLQTERPCRVVIWEYDIECVTGVKSLHNLGADVVTGQKECRHFELFEIDQHRLVGNEGVLIDHFSDFTRGAEERRVCSS